MFYFRFVGWLISKTDAFATRHSGAKDTLSYNKMPAWYYAPLAQLFRLIIVSLFIGLPIIGFLYLVHALPVSANVQWLIVVITSTVIFITTARVLFKNARR